MHSNIKCIDVTYGIQKLRVHDSTTLLHINNCYNLSFFSATIPIVVSSDGSVQILTTTTAMNTYLGQNSFPNTGFYPPQYAGAAYAPECK